MIWSSRRRRGTDATETALRGSINIVRLYNRATL